jgi:uncharacterized protein (TIGR02421 family)
VQSVEQSLLGAVRTRLSAGQRVHRVLPAQGRLHIDRPLPFLVVYRWPADRPDPGTGRLVLGESSYLIAPGDESHEASVGEVVEAVVRTLAEQFNAFLLLEIWAGDEETHLSTRPTFHVHMPHKGVPRQTVAALVRGLRRIRLDWRRARVQLHSGGHAPPGLPPLLTIEQAQRYACMMLGLQVPPTWRGAHGTMFPLVLTRLHRHFSRALRKTFFAFTRVQTRATVEHYHALGRTALGKAVWDVDRQLAEISDEFHFLLAVTPVNTRDALEAFTARGFEHEPVFHYRLLSFDPDLLKRRLYEIPIEKVEDPALGELFRQKRVELDRQITMLEDRQTHRFYHGSMQLYGGVDDTLLGHAKQLLAVVPARRDESAELIDAAGFAQRARAQIDAYRSAQALTDARVQIRGDVPGLLVSDGTLFLGQDLMLPARRVEALLAHEVGTHVLTYLNGQAQRLQLLRCGLSGCEELQEGIAVLSEWLVGGLTRARMRRLAARVLAVRRLVEGASFVDVFRELSGDHGFSGAAAFSVAMRVFRGGGLTKDAIYLRGLSRLLGHLQRGGSLDELFVGKISLASLPVVRELRWRQVVGAPMLRPLHLDAPSAVARLDRLRRGIGVVDLLNEGVA